MATKTAFTLTDDNGTTSYPDDGGSGWGLTSNDPGLTYQAIGRYQRIGTSGKILAYPANDDSGFNIPRVRFMFMTAYGEVIPNTPILYLKFPGSFNLTSLSDYSRTEAIFAGGRDMYSTLAQSALGQKQTDAKTGGALQAAIDSIGMAGVSGIEALQYAIKYGAANALGRFSSAGMSNIGQYEFQERNAVNPMAQLLYKGPQLRRYQLPFVFHPKNKKDSDAIKSIISTFRVASSPAVPDVSGSLGTIRLGAGNSFTLGYPHLTQFTVAFLTSSNQTLTGAKKIFRSKACIIESVSVDYGGQKSTFFEDGSPTEMNLTIQLTEVMPRTLGDASTDAIGPDITMS